MQISENNLVHLVLAAVGAAWLVVQLMTNGKIEEVKTNITAKVGEIKTDIAETNGLIKEHIASDLQKHNAIDHRLDLLEK